ncbi:ferric reductase-like transmembrane domain-containing protein [Yoonia sp. 208BN28-4]|uniref:ferric reductase-like transmembrane domain-containing protein n=1 Tax=Yoonia sp. 208BN28-4 TaxID=3126505 RepID=UPI0030ACD6A6
MILLPLVLAAASPQLAWREPIYIFAGFSGIIAMGVMLIQPLLATAALPAIAMARSRRLHRLCGLILVIAVLAHVAGLWLTSPPDVIDALTFTSPALFSVWGVIAMWAVFAAAGLVAIRRIWRLRWRTWRLGHIALVSIAVVGSVAHVVPIQGTMEFYSKLALCAALIAATGYAAGKAVIGQRR